MSELFPVKGKELLQIKCAVRNKKAIPTGWLFCCGLAGICPTTSGGEVLRGAGSTVVRWITIRSLLRYVRYCQQVNRSL